MLEEGEIRFEPGEDFTSLDDDDFDSVHGYRVLTELFHFAPLAEFRTYRVTQNGIPKDRVMKAISSAKEDDCHLIHMSIGEPISSDYPDHMFLCGTAEEAFEDGSLVIAAAGHKTERTTQVRCPATSRKTGAIDGYIARCEGRSFGDVPASGAYMIRNDEDESDQPVDKTEATTSWIQLCGFQDCDSDKRRSTCDRNQLIKPWEGSPEYDVREPDTMVPMTWPSKISDEETLCLGTSYGAPVVTSSLACILSDLDDGVYPNNEDILEAIRSSNDESDDLPLGRFNYEKLQSELASI